VLFEAERQTLEKKAKRCRTVEGLALRRGSCWPARTAGPISPSPHGWASAGARSASGGPGSRPGGWTGWAMNPPSDSAAHHHRCPGGGGGADLGRGHGGATHWSKRELAKRVGISPTGVHRIWRAFALQPCRTEDFKISPGPLLIDEIRDVVGPHLAPSATTPAPTWTPGCPPAPRPAAGITEYLPT
jgi:hypothetical protein